ncbi:MAG: HD domain-containing protein [Pirellulaceae bacterium]
MPDASTGLRDFLATRNTAVFDETVRLVNEAYPLLWHTLSTFPSGTSHTPEHTFTVEKILTMLVSKAVLSQLNDDELQLLILGCHYHDLGMAGTEADNATPAGQDQARRDHGVRIGDLLREKWQYLGFRDLALADALAEVCRGHRPPKVNGVASWETTRETAILAPSRSARLRVVSALVYAADELHIGADRASVKQEQWLQIGNDEARRHWKRHQLIRGPAIVDGCLRFDVTPPTIALERDLRKHVLLKALSAVKASNSLLASQGIGEELNPITIVWNRESLWRLLMVHELSDLVPRSRECISDAVISAYESAAKDFADLTSYACITHDDKESLRAEIARVVADYTCRGLFLSSEGLEGERFVMNTDMPAADVFFQTAKQADDLDVLFEGRYAAHFDFGLQRSAFGIRHTELSVEPLVRATYGLLNVSAAETTFTLLRLSPTARRLAIEGAPSPSILAKTHALALAVVSGASLDLLRDPTLILDATFRTAYRALTSLVAKEQPAFSRLIEELALVDGYTFEQLCEAIIPSAEAAEAFNRSIGHDGSTVPGSTSITISQTMPANVRPIAVSFPHLYLAGHRAKTTVEILNTHEAPLKVKEENPDGSDSRREVTGVAFGPGRRRIAPTLAQRADFDFDANKRELCLSVRPCTPVLDCDAPLLMRLNSQQLISGEQTTVTFSFYFPAINARHMRLFKQLAELRDTDTVTVRLESDIGKKMGETTNTLEGEQIRPWKVDVDDPEFVEFLYSKSPSTPFPWWCAADVRKAVDSRDSAEWDTIYERYVTIPIAEKEQVTSLTLRVAQEDGREYAEEFFGFFPSLKMRAPKVDPESKTSQEEIDRLWEESAMDCMVGGSFSADEHEIAKTVRDWAADPSQPFPIGVSGDPPSTPVFRARCEIIHRPRIDRLWYVERRLIIRLRPINDEERWTVEGHYWQSKGDKARESIIVERISELRAPDRSEPNAASASEKNVSEPSTDSSK